MQMGSSDLYFKKAKLMDEAHPAKELAVAMSECIKQFILTMIRNREAREVLELQKNVPEQDLRGRLDGQRDKREPHGKILLNFFTIVYLIVNMVDN